MPKTSPSVQPVAWTIRELPDELRYIDGLMMPSPMFQSLSHLQSIHEKTPAFTGLHDLLGASSHQIVAFQPAFWKQNPDNAGWLYAINSGELNKERLRTLIQLWLLATYGQETAKQVVEEWINLDWCRTRIDLSVADRELSFSLFPALVARWLLNQKHELTLDSHSGPVVMSLRLVPLMSNRKYAELMTEPREINRQLTSVVMRFWMETIPVSGEPVLLYRSMIRRWMRGSFVDEATGRVRLRIREGRSVYLRHPAGYLDKTLRDDVFSRIQLRYTGGSKENVFWTGNQAKVFAQAGIAILPSPQEYVADLTGYQGQLLTPVQNRDGAKMSVTGGLKVADHLQILAELDAQLRHFTDLMPHWIRNVKGDAGKTGWKSINRKPIKTIPMSTRFEALKSMPHPLRIELHTGEITEATSAILSAVGVHHTPEDLDNKNLTVKDDNDNTLLEIVPLHDETITDLLPASANNATWKLLRNLEKERQQYITRKYPRPKHPTGTLVMLPDYRKSYTKRDPKSAIRKGLIQSGRVSQFYTPRIKGESAESMKHRAQSATGDLLRALDYRYGPYYRQPEHSNLPEHLDLIVLWLLQRNARRRDKTKPVMLPLVIEASVSQLSLKVSLPRNTGTAELYLSIREALIAASAIDFDFERPEQTVNFFRNAMEQRQSANPALLLLAEQNLRRVFDELKVQTVTTVTLNGILDPASNIRVARLRFSSYDEVPFCLPGEEHSKYQGLYEHSAYPGVFYSLHNLPETLVKPSIHHRKLNRPKEPSLNPSTVQIWLNNLQPEDIPSEWAALVHLLRRESSHTDNTTKFPQPMHNVEIFRKYVDRLVNEADSDEELRDAEE